MKQLSLIFLIVASFNLNAQFSIEPQIGLSYSKFDVLYFGGNVNEPIQTKTFPSIGLRFNYALDRVLLSTQYNVHWINEFNLEHNFLVFLPEEYAKVGNREMSLSCTYRLVENFNVGVGAMLWNYSNIESANGFIAERSEYTNTYASLIASYMVRKIRIELNLSKYLSVIGKSDDKAFQEILRAPEIFSIKIGYNISFNKRDSKG